MAEIKIDGRMKVKTLQAQFKNAFGATLRVYKGKQFADGDLTLASIRGDGAKGGEFSCRGNLLVGNFEKKMKDAFGITVQVANPDNTKLSDDNMTMTAAGKE